MGGSPFVRGASLGSSYQALRSDRRREQTSPAPILSAQDGVVTLFLSFNRCRPLGDVVRVVGSAHRIRAEALRTETGCYEVEQLLRWLKGFRRLFAWFDKLDVVFLFFTRRCSVSMRHTRTCGAEVLTRPVARQEGEVGSRTFFLFCEATAL